MPSVAQSTVTSVAADTTVKTLADVNSSRRGLDVYNDSASAMYLKLGSAATNASFTVKVAAGGFYEMPEPMYTGVVSAIWDSASGNARVTEKQ